MITSTTLREIKCSKEKKAIYTLLAWLLKKERTKHEVVVRVCGFYAQHKEDYFTKKMRQYHKVHKNKYKSSFKLLERNKKLAAEQRRVYKLYKTGMLSKTSTRIIEA